MGDSNSYIHILGFDIGGTKSNITLGRYRRGSQETPEIISTRAIMTPHVDESLSIEDCLEKFFAEADIQLKEHKNFKPEVVGVSVGGPLDIDNGKLICPPHLPGWENLELKKILEKRFGVPTYVEHDGNAGAVAEWLFGAGKGFKDVVFLTMGTGFGAGMILNGQLYRGHSSTAGEIGHVRIADRGPEGFGKNGSVEGFCSGSGMVRYALYLYPDYQWPHPLTAKELLELANAGNRVAKDVIQKAGVKLGRTLAMVVDLLNPEIIIIGSLAMRMKNLVLKPALEEMRQEALSMASEALEVTTPKLGPNFQQIAALTAAIYRLEFESK